MNEGSTHWEGCWREHHECAVAEIHRLVRLLDRCRNQVVSVTIRDGINAVLRAYVSKGGMSEWDGQ